MLEARSTHLVIAHFNKYYDIVLWSSASLLPHEHINIHDDKLATCYKDVSEHCRDCIGNSSKVEAAGFGFYCYQ